MWNILTAVIVHIVIILLVKEVNSASVGDRKQPINDVDVENVEVKERPASDKDVLNFNFLAFGEEFNLVLLKNGQLTIPQAQVIRRHNGRTVSRENLNDYFTGYLENKPGSSLVLKVNNGSLSGVIVTNNHWLTIHSLNEGLRHVVTRRKHDNDTLPDSTLYNKMNHFTRTKRSTSNNRYVEVMMVADRYTTEAYGNFTEQYIMAVVNLLSAVMQDDSIGSIKVMYTIVKIMIISGDEKGLDITENNVEGSVEYLSLFGTWVSQFNTADDSDPKHFDQAILITRKVCGLADQCYENGRGYFNDMCSKTRSVASAIAAGLSAGLTAAHETGHNFGLSHDSGDCSNGYIMDAALAAGSNAFSWSPCSRNTLQTKFSDSSKFSCLNDIPAGRGTEHSITVVDLATKYSGDDQCRLMYGDDYSHCGPFKSNCKTLYCRKSGTNTCIHRSTPPLEGTICGTYKWCKNGECVDQPIPDPIDGQWSSWSDSYSDCTASCGMGVKYRTRACDNPRPEYFGKDCEGESKGHYETCNTQDCSEGIDDLHMKQCKDKDPSYTTYHDKTAPCLLRCKAGSVVRIYQSTVLDGTRCSPYLDERDVCVLGQCKKVGCDRTFDRKFYDRCRVCSGDGSMCRLVKTSYDTVHRGYGKNNAAVMFTLPIGSANLLVQETSATYNNIGLKDQNDKWIIHDQTGSSNSIYAAGSRIIFERSSSKAAEKLVIKGPTTEPLKVMFIYWFETNSGIPYEYYERLSTPDSTSPTFIWKYTLSECSEACAGGVKTKITTCHRTDDDTEVGLEHCDDKTEPTDVVACNIQACEPSWQADDWSSCSADCGPNGTRTRTVECRQKISADVTNVLPDEQCTGTKDVDSEDCHRIDCEPDWVPAEWSACSKNKCEGVQTRSLSCKKLLVTGEIQDLTDSDCPSERPPTELICNAGVHCYEWRPVYPSCSECRDYFTDTDGSRYKPVGCYKLDSKPLGPMLTKITVDSLNKEATVSKCGSVAWKRARHVFAVGSNGECYSSMNGHEVYYKDGEINNCVDDKIGGVNSVYVYALIGKVLLSTPTCYSVENENFLAQTSNCEVLVPRPAPEIKICCEELCKDNCYKTKAGSYCVIPFIFRGKMYHECTRNYNGKMWCATTSNFDIDGEGGECEEPCRKQTTSGKCCSFPFIYRGRLYNTCTSTGAGQSWCSLTSNFDRDRLRETCV